MLLLADFKVQTSIMLFFIAWQLGQIGIPFWNITDSNKETDLGASGEGSIRQIALFFLRRCQIVSFGSHYFLVPTILIYI